MLDLYGQNSVLTCASIISHICIYIYIHAGLMLFVLLWLIDHFQMTIHVILSFLFWLVKAVAYSQNPTGSQEHYSDVIMSAMGSQITGISFVCSSVCLGADQRNHRSSALLGLWGESTSDWWIPLTKGQSGGKCFHLMTSSIYQIQMDKLSRDYSNRPLNTDVIFFHPLDLVPIASQNMIDSSLNINWGQLVHARSK